MRLSFRGLFSVLLITFTVVGFLFAQVGGPAQPGAATGRKVVFMRADNSHSLLLGDSTVLCMVGNFAALHNGTVITCDSAVRYNDLHVECFGNVLINKKTTYIYGDRVVYDGLLNRAEVFSPLVKVIDGDATLYTYQFIFNTKLNIGEFNGGGVMTNKDNLLEATHGYYYTDTHDIICVGEVEMKNDKYQMTGDSVVYNTNTDHAQYFTNTNIWNEKNEYLYGDRGEYMKPEERYVITRNGYILTEKQELWSDSLDYARSTEHVILHRNVQIDDTEHKTLAFGDYGEYWKTPGNALLTLRPSLVNYDPKQKSDSLFMRADTIFYYTIITTQQVAEEAADSAAVKPATANLKSTSASTEDTKSTTKRDLSEENDKEMLSIEADTTQINPPQAGLEKGAIETKIDSLDKKQPAAEKAPEMTIEEKKAQLREIAEKEREEKKKQEAAARKIKLEEIAAKRQAKITAQLLLQKERDSISLVARKLKAEKKLQERRERALRKGLPLPDSTEVKTIDSLFQDATASRDSLSGIDSLAVPVDSVALQRARDSMDSVAAADTIRRFVRAYRKVKIFRTDFQAVCDSLVGVGVDSTMHLYILPVLWNENNQITSEVMDLFSKNQKLVRGEFVGRPIMIAQLDTAYYNQVSGKTMTAFFRNNEIYQNDVNGNVQTLYYMQDDDDSKKVVDMLSIKSGAASFYIEDKAVVGITYRSEPIFSMFPLDRIPETQERYLKDFNWEGKRRPTKAEVFDRTIRSSQREQKRRLRKPHFPIRERVDSYRDRLVLSGQWADRTDQLLPQTVDWVRSKGY
ncbi:MAG: OstA-like protein [Alistipes sp.]